jgi:hypothetical protein
LSSFSPANLPQFTAEDLLNEKKSREKKTKPEVKHSKSTELHFPMIADGVNRQELFEFQTNWFAEDPLHVLEPDWDHVPLMLLGPLPELDVTSSTWFDEIVSDCPSTQSIGDCENEEATILGSSWRESL